jgi:glycosyltransferase involved in cell wall biosynthesis
LTAFWGLLLARLHGISVISVVHNTFLAAEKPKLRVNRLLMNLVDVVLAVAETQKKHLVEQEGLPASLVRVIHNGIDLERFRPTVGREEMCRTLKLNPLHPVVGIVARLVPLKGLDFFLQAASTVLAKFPDTQFVIVGDGPENERLRALAARLAVASKVSFLGSRDDVADVIQIFDLAVLCSRTEALPMVILEYMALSKPVITTEVGGARELVDDEKTGLVIPPANAQALAGALLDLLGAPTLARQMGEKGRAKVESSFSIASTVEKTERLFEELLGRKPRPSLRSPARLVQVETIKKFSGS